MRKLRSLILLATICCLVVTSLPARAEEADAAKIYQQTVRATALVRGAKSATGWLLDREQKLLVTSYYAVGKEKSVQVIFPEFKENKLITERAYYEKNAKPITGQVLARMPDRDLALIQLESVPDGLKALKLAADSPVPGDQLHAVVNTDASHGLWSYANGFVRQINRKKESYAGVTLDARVILCQIPINAGDSGSPIVNDAGKLVGVAAGTVGGARLVTFCVDLSEVREFLAKNQPKQENPEKKGADAPNSDPAPEPKEPTRRSHYQDLMHSTVWIVSTGPVKGRGTGCLVDRQRKLVLTALHMVGDDETAKVWFPVFEDGKLQPLHAYYTQKIKPIQARVIHREPRCGLAVLELESLPEGVTELKIAAASAAPGESAYGVGNSTLSSGLWVFQTGAVRQVYKRDSRSENKAWNACVLEIQTPFNRGDEGGPVVNAHGELIGIAEMHAPKAQYVTGCLDGTEIRNVLNAIKKD